MAPTHDPCGVPGCPEILRHEHRKCRWTIEDDVFWYELRSYELPWLNEALAVHDRPRLIFTQEPRPSPEQADTPQ